LNENLNLIQQSQFVIFWHNYIYEAFSDLKYTKRDAFKRKRELALSIPIDKELDVDQLIELKSKHCQKIRYREQSHGSQRYQRIARSPSGGEDRQKIHGKHSNTQGHDAWQKGLMLKLSSRRTSVRLPS